MKNLSATWPACAPRTTDMKAHGGWRIEGGPGHWRWIAPAKPPSAGAIARTRKVAAAKTMARRNNPLRT
jgi:hypothetical protein